METSAGVLVFKGAFYALVLVYMLQFWLRRGPLYRFIVALARKDGKANFNEKAFRVSQLVVGWLVLLVSVYLDLKRR